MGCCMSFRFAVVSHALQADSLRSQLERTMDEFKAKETDQEAQKKQLTSVVEGLLRKVKTFAKKTTHS